MALCIRKGVAIVALFSALNASADWFEDLARTPKEKLHQPPTWLDHLATIPKSKPSDSIPFILPVPSSSIGKPAKQGRILKACRNEYGEWAFCDI